MLQIPLFYYLFHDNSFIETSSSPIHPNEKRNVSSFDLFLIFTYIEDTAEYRKSALFRRNYAVKDELHSFEKLTEDYKPMILKLIKSLNIYKDLDSYYQCGLIGLWEAHERFNPEKGKFSTFAYSTVRGKLLDQLSKERRFDDRHQVTVNFFAFNVIDENTIVPFEEEMLLCYCEGLTEKQVKWVTYTFLENKKLSEIAKEENVSTETVKAWRKASLRKLKHFIQSGDQP